jgi:hypothetical protein
MDDVAMGDAAMGDVAMGDATPHTSVPDEGLADDDGPHWPAWHHPPRYDQVPAWLLVASPPHWPAWHHPPRSDQVHAHDRMGAWSADDDLRLKQAVMELGTAWAVVAGQFGADRTLEAVRRHYHNHLKATLSMCRPDFGSCEKALSQASTTHSLHINNEITKSPCGERRPVRSRDRDRCNPWPISHTFLASHSHNGDVEVNAHYLLTSTRNSPRTRVDRVIRELARIDDATPAPSEAA